MRASQRAHIAIDGTCSIQQLEQNSCLTGPIGYRFRYALAASAVAICLRAPSTINTFTYANPANQTSIYCYLPFSLLDARWELVLRLMWL